MDTDTRWLQGLQSLNITNPARDPKYYDLLTILQHCPELEALSLAFSGQQGVPDPNDRASETIELRALRRLELGINEAAYVEELLGQLFIPDLRLLEIQNGIYTRPPFASAMLRPYQQTGHCVLNSVETFICDNGIEMQDEIFAALQNVRTLLLGEEQDLLSSLFPNDEPLGRVVCPKLETIILWSSKDELKAFVSARMHAGAPLSTIIASFEEFGDNGAGAGEKLTDDEQAWFESAVDRFRIRLDQEYLDVDELALNPVPRNLFPTLDPKLAYQTWRPNSVFRTSRAEGWAWHLNGPPPVDSAT
ncbi:hypothetical protein EWM64_g2264 [Hericium alpestre]|uniref:Uncharacterized protein n=1 Tax=Hericium alpestre TaxID=135208 RepID=A0A4Z0A3Y8_9AGAM|nr:hypothetical protein EWM64_g2264 [Hericium alpestre]